MFLFPCFYQFPVKNAAFASASHMPVAFSLPILQFSSLMKSLVGYFAAYPSISFMWKCHRMRMDWWMLGNNAEDALLLLIRWIPLAASLLTRWRHYWPGLFIWKLLFVCFQILFLKRNHFKESYSDGELNSVFQKETFQRRYRFACRAETVSN